MHHRIANCTANYCSLLWFPWAGRKEVEYLQRLFCFLLLEKMLRNKSSGVPIECCVTASWNLGRRNNNRVSKAQILNKVKELYSFKFCGKYVLHGQVMIIIKVLYCLARVIFVISFLCILVTSVVWFCLFFYFPFGLSCFANWVSTQT